MLKNMNRKQKRLFLTVLLLMVISVVALIAMFFFAAYLAVTDTTNTDDIFGSGAYIFVAILIACHLIPSFASFPVLLHSGLYALKSTPRSIAKCLHYISSGIALIIILSYGLGVVDDIFSFIFSWGTRPYMWVLSDTFFMIAGLASFISIVLDIIGTILHKREQKRQLKSADSQKTA